MIETIRFRDNKGNVVHLRKSLRIKDLVAMGIKGIRIAPEGTPLPDDWYEDDEHETKDSK